FAGGAAGPAVGAPLGRVGGVRMIGWPRGGVGWALGEAAAPRSAATRGAARMGRARPRLPEKVRGGGGENADPVGVMSSSFILVRIVAVGLRRIVRTGSPLLRLRELGTGLRTGGGRLGLRRRVALLRKHPARNGHEQEASECHEGRGSENERTDGDERAFEQA